MIGTEAVWSSRAGRRHFFGARTTRQGKHRTEVTEATERDDWDGRLSGARSRAGRRHFFGARTTRQEEQGDRTEVTEATERRLFRDRSHFKRCPG